MKYAIGTIAAVLMLSACNDGALAPEPASEAGDDAGAAREPAAGPDDASPAVKATDQAAQTDKKSAANAGASSTCAPRETTIFACTMENGKKLEVCSGGGTKATYRYGGKQAEIELEGGRWARVGYSGGGELQIAFDNGATRYVVFGRTIRTNFEPDETNDPVSRDGVVVLRNDRFQSIQLCRADSDTAAYSEAAEAALQRLPQSEELFTEETARADPE
jgi:hypothetical protein